MSSGKSESRSSGSNGLNANQLFEKAKPFTENLIKLYVMLLPYWALATQHINTVWAKIKPYYEKYYVPDMAECAIGFVLLFFGGQFAMTIACYTALQISGLPIIKNSWNKIQANYHSAKEAFEKDEIAKQYVDENNDGNISTEEIIQATKKFVQGSSEEKLKAITSLKTVILAVDPQEVMNGFAGIWGSLLTVIATLRSAFAKDVALGVSLGENITKSLSKYVRPWLIQNQDKEFKQWIDFLFSTFCKMTGVGLALLLARLVSAFHSAVKGGSIIGYLLFRYLASKKLLPTEIQDAIAQFNSSSSSSSSTFSSSSSDVGGISNSNGNGNSSGSDKEKKKDILEQNGLFMVIQYGLAFYGFYWQVSQGFQLRKWYLRLLLLPFSITEGILTWLASY